MADMTVGQARRIALAAQGLGARRRSSDDGTDRTPGVRQLTALVRRLGLLQIDSVNVFDRSHYLPVLARLGPYDKAHLDRLTLRPGARHVEYWAHMAAFIPVTDWPLMRWRMERYRDTYGAGRDDWVAANLSLLDWLRADLAANGPRAASEVEHEANTRRGNWWGWSDVKRGLEMLFFWGEVTSAGRKGFERRYALAEHVIPAALRDQVVPQDDAVRELVRRSALAHGVGTLADLADYYRLPVALARAAAADLVDAGDLVPVRVEGWRDQAYLARDARRPRRVDAAALLSPFDPVVWFRPRAERLFDFHYRIEIYTPRHKRVYGYYTLPLLLGDAIAGRVDLKSDRQAGVLRVQSAWREPGAPADTAERLLPLLREAASWQGLDAIEVAGRGDLSPALAAVVAAGVGHA